MTDRTSPARTSSQQGVRPWVPMLAWGIGFACLIAFAVIRLELFPLTTTIGADSGSMSLPRAFFTVDHPFHTARTEQIRAALASFDTIRWVGSHQGGYPAEFFPFGLPAVAALLSVLTFGALAIESAWAITIVLVFLLPGLAFVLLGREDRLSPAVALVALAGQIGIASDWTHGGFTELVEWGLATNVAGATYALLSIPLLVRASEQRSARALGTASIVIALCAVSNPRSLIAVSLIAAAMILHAVVFRRWRDGFVTVAIAAILSVGLAAPVVVPLLRYSDLYFFLSYQEYDGIAAYWDATVDAVTWPVVLLAALGGTLAFLRRSHRATQVTTIALIGYMVATAAAAASPSLRELIPQLELPRLMPFQRFAIIYLAAYGVVEVLRWGIRVPARLGLLRDGVLAGAVAVVVLAVFASGAGPFDPLEQGLRDVPRTEAAEGVELSEFREAIALADDLAPDETAILVIGTQLSWHEQLWAPMSAESRRFYYDNWLWYWHQRHDGPYDYRVGHHYPNPSQALSDEYLLTNGIGAVVITDIIDQGTGANARVEAQNADDLELDTTIGAWDVYTVTEQTSLATLNGEPPDSVAVSDEFETVTVSFTDAEPGTLVVRQNWFPRWSAEVNGEPADISRAENGYIEVETEGGDIEVTLTYGVTGADTITRVASVVSALVVLALLIAPAPMARWARRLSSAGRASAPQ